MSSMVSLISKELYKKNKCDCWCHGGTEWGYHGQIEDTGQMYYGYQGWTHKQKHATVAVTAKLPLCKFDKNA